MKKILSNVYLRYSLLVLGGIFLGWLFFHSPNSNSTEDRQNHSHEKEATIWTCSMHPQIRKPDPGKCPICGMDLIPLSQSNTGFDGDAIHLSKDAAELANVLTSVVKRQKPIKEVRLYGKVQADERLLQSQVAHIPGRIEKLMVNFTGEPVRKGQTLALIYSPELITAQQELLEASKTKQIQPEIYEAAKERLQLWKLTDSQIDKIEQTGSVERDFEIVSNTNGVVSERRVNNGDYVSQGAVLYQITDLSRVWVMLDAYESDLLFLKKGNTITFTVQAIPGKTFKGNISFIDPVIDPATRVSKVRVEMDNESGNLKPEMFVTGIVNANLAEYRDKLIIPRSAVLWTGKRSVVYVKQAGIDDPIFKVRDIELGPMLGNSYVVLNGLQEGEEIVTQGTFSVDAAAQLEGKPSMMNPRSTHTEQQVPSEAHNETSPEEHQTSDAISKQNSSVNKEFAKQLNPVYEQYVVMKNSFVQSNAKEVKHNANNLQQSLSRVDAKRLSGDDKMKWDDLTVKLKKQLNTIIVSDKLEDQRTAFSDLNSTFYKVIKTFGLTKETVYYQFCPMANNNKGAYWLSENSEIRNPYYGDEMLTCGETKEVLKY